MPGITIVKESPVVRSARVAQLEGLFDMPPSERAAESWEVDLTLPDEWNVGLIVGPSGSGKSTVARELFGQALVGEWDWDRDHSLVDSFPREMGIKEIVELLNSVGFSSPPSWLKPYHVLSNGEKFRVDMARTLAEQPELAVVDEFTSVVDRTVAQIGSAAIAKTVRRRNQKFIAVACHYDIIEWLEPDWIYQPHSGELVVGRSRRRPDLEIELQRVDSSVWVLFKKHHYLDTSLNKAAACFLATWNGVPVAFASVLHFPHARVKNMKREHRTVCLPDYQGVGIGNAVSDMVGSMVTALGYRYQSQTAHPSMISSRNRSPNWVLVKEPTYEKSKPGKNSKIMSWHNNARIRFVASFEYVGPKMPFETALKLWRGG